MDARQERRELGGTRQGRRSGTKMRGKKRQDRPAIGLRQKRGWRGQK